MERTTLPPDATPEQRAVAAIQQGRDYLVRALDRLEHPHDLEAAGTLVGRGSDEIGRAIYYLRRLLREREAELSG